jgi:pimeloyl-ACP methyl ester carboxylesterase
VNRVFLTGASEGGLVTALALEKYPQQFAGGLSTCGPVGSFLDQVKYWGDFRVAFDNYFPFVLANPLDPTIGVPPFGPSTPVAIDPFVVSNWETIDTNFVRPWLASNLAGVQGLLAETGVPIDPADPVNTAGKSILGLLYYNVESTNNGRMVLNPAVAADPSLLLPPSLAGNPYENLTYITPYYPEGLRRDPVALAEIIANYETSAALDRPLVLMHTTGDPIIPFWQPLGYLEKAARAGTLSKTTFIPVNRYGHCSFTAPEIVFGFYVMVMRSTMIPFSSAQIQATLPEAAQQAEFRMLREKQPDSVR